MHLWERLLFFYRLKQEKRAAKNQLARQREMYDARLVASTARYEQLQQENDGLRATGREEKTFTLLAVGRRGAGKTEAASYFVNPMATGKVAPTDTVSAYAPVPLAQVGGAVMSIRVIDVPGEKLGDWVNAIVAIDRTTPDGEGIVLMVVWDLEKGLVENAKALSREVLQAVFANDLAIKRIRNVVVVLNKVDLLKSPEKAIKDAKEHLAVLDGMNLGEAEYVVTSAKDGTGTQRLRAAVFSAFGIGQAFPTMPEGGGS